MFYSQPSRTSFQPVDFYYGVPQYERRHSFIAPDFFQSREESSAENYYRRLAEEHQRKAQIALARAKQEEEMIAERQRRVAIIRRRQVQAHRQLQQQEIQSYLDAALHSSAIPPVFSFAPRNRPTVSPEQQLHNEREARFEAYLMACREKERGEEQARARTREHNAETEASAIAEVMELLGLIRQDSDRSSHCATDKCRSQMAGKCCPPLQAVARGAGPTIVHPVNQGNQPAKSVRIQEPVSTPSDVKGKGKEVPSQRNGPTLRPYAEFFPYIIFNAAQPADVVGSSTSTQNSSEGSTYRSRPAAPAPSSQSPKSPNFYARSPSTSTPAPRQTPEHRRTSSLDSISGLQAKFDSLKATFTLPDHLEFSSTDSVPKLLFSPANASVNQYENNLTKLLTKLDAVESNGDEKIREFRKNLVKKVEAELDHLDSKKAALWEASKRAGTVTKKEAVEEQPLIDLAPAASDNSQDESAVVLSEDEDVQDAPEQSQTGYVVSFPTSAPALEDSTLSTAPYPTPVSLVTDVVNDTVEHDSDTPVTPANILQDQVVEASVSAILENHTLASTPETSEDEVDTVHKAEEAQPPSVDIPDTLQEAVPTTPAPFLATLNPVDDSTISSVPHSLTLPEVDQAAPASPALSEKSLVDVSVDDLRELAKDGENSKEKVLDRGDHSDNEFEML